MGEFVTSTGLKKKTLQELRLEFENGFKRVFGPEFETSVDSPNGLFISQLSLSFSKLWDLALEVFSSRDPAQATGVALDWAAALDNLNRREATACEVKAMLYTEDSTASIPAGSRALRSRGALPFVLSGSVSIDRAACKQLLIVDDGSAKNTSYSFVFTFGTVTLNNATFASNLSVLKTSILAAGGQAEFLTSDESDGLTVYLEGEDVGITGILPDDFIIYAGSEGTFFAESVGAQTCEVGELNDILSSVSGWDKIYNQVVGIPGTDMETDEALRIRRAAAVRSIKAKATDSAIAAHLMEEVEGVTVATVVSNRTMDTDADGRPPKSFEALVVGGTDQAVAKNIWENQPSGIQSYGNTSIEISDGEGIGQIISFSRPQAKYLWVKIEWQRYSEEVAPTNDEIKAALLQWAEKEYQMGVDVISQRLLQGLYSGTTGIGNATANVAITDSPTDTPVYEGALAQIPIAPSDYVLLAADRITIIEDA